jgi:hypothetical protein
LLFRISNISCTSIFANHRYGTGMAWSPLSAGGSSSQARLHRGQFMLIGMVPFRHSPSSAGGRTHRSESFRDRISFEP